MSKYLEVLEALKSLAKPEDVEKKAKFFKAIPGGYGEADQFLGVSVPDQRAVAKAAYKALNDEDLIEILKSPFHEMRLCALFMLVHHFQSAKKIPDRKKAIAALYLAQLDYVNNWDLVDSSTHKILGPYVHETGQWEILEQLAESDDMWRKRVAVVALWYLFKEGYHDQGLRLIEKNLNHRHDLMHKANGWMLRELGAFDEGKMIEFINLHYHNLPRTTLRYAIEKLPESQRQEILKGIF